MEAMSFQHYLETQTIITHVEAQARLDGLVGESGKVVLTEADYILGLFEHSPA